MMSQNLRFLNQTERVPFRYYNLAIYMDALSSYLKKYKFKVAKHLGRMGNTTKELHNALHTENTRETGSPTLQIFLTAIVCLVYRSPDKAANPTAHRPTSPAVCK